MYAVMACAAYQSFSGQRNAHDFPGFQLLPRKIMCVHFIIHILLANPGPGMHRIIHSFQRHLCCVSQKDPSQDTDTGNNHVLLTHPIHPQWDIRLQQQCSSTRSCL